MRRTRLVLAAVLLPLVAACSTDETSAPQAGSGSTSTDSTAESSGTTPTEPTLPCPSNIPMEGHSDDCTGALPIGTATSDKFKPRVRFQISERGWIPINDTRNIFALLPPGGDFAGIDDGTSDKVAIYAPIYALSRRCANEGQLTAEQPGVGHTAEGIAQELSTRPGVTGSDPEPVSIGGLRGYVVDVRIDPHWTRTCFFSDVPTVPMIGRRSPSEVIQTLQPGFTYRYYFLDRTGSTLAIEVQDAGRDDRDWYSSLVDTFLFG